jgi:very-short-patch-repair endonuclease
MFSYCSDMAQVRTPRSAMLLKRARRMRREPTRAEARLWRALRAHRLGGWKWRRQAPFGAFIVDFLCDQAGLVVELDGEVHGETQGYDADRTEYLRRFGFRVLRFRNDEVLTDVEVVCFRILRACGGDRPGSRSLASAAARYAPPTP